MITSRVLSAPIFIAVSLFMFCSAPQKKTRVIFFGDSLTELAVKPNGFITKIDSISKAGNHPSYEFIGSGISGDKVYDLYLRMHKDVLALNPNVVVILIGVNDVWHKRLLGTGSDPDKFGRFYQAIIDTLKSRSIRIILCTPPVIGEKTDNSNEQDGDMNNFSNVIRDLARKNNLQLVDLRKIFLDHLSKHNSENKERGILTTDRVHLSSGGNQTVAEEIWKVLAAQ